MSKNQHQNVETHEELSEVLKVRREKLQRKSWYLCTWINFAWNVLDIQHRERKTNHIDERAKGSDTWGDEGVP